MRDQHGILRLSQAAKDYHPGQGVYRSSYKNARRLTATETNIAYHTADHDRWQKMDFVVGIEIKLSGNHTCLGSDGKPHPFYDICDELQGKYPKDFKFTGWHPHCRCFATPILKTWEEMAADDERILSGEEPTTESVNTVRDMPDKFKQWTEANQERIDRAKSLPYFIKDNGRYFNIATQEKIRVLYPTATIITEPTPLTILQRAEARHAARTPEQVQAIQQAWAERDEKVIPAELRIGGTYLRDNEDGFNPAFFKLIDPNKPIKLKIENNDKGSYSISNEVVIRNVTRINDSPWLQKSVIYHEYGHVIDGQRNLWEDNALSNMRKRHIAWLKGKETYTYLAKRFDNTQDRYVYERVTDNLSRVVDIDKRLDALYRRIEKMDTTGKVGEFGNKHDVLEKILSTRDTIKSLVIDFGVGHSTSYFRQRRHRETEYLAHAFENAFIGNDVFKKYLPEIYQDMIDYIGMLKTVQ